VAAVIATPAAQEQSNSERKVMISFMRRDGKGRAEARPLHALNGRLRKRLELLPDKLQSELDNAPIGCAPYSPKTPGSNGRRRIIEIDLVEGVEKLRPELHRV